MNENQTDNQPGFFDTITHDEGVQRAIAGVAVAIVVASVKHLVFGAS